MVNEFDDYIDITNMILHVLFETMNIHLSKTFVRNNPNDKAIDCLLYDLGFVDGVHCLNNRTEAKELPPIWCETDVFPPAFNSF